MDLEYFMRDFSLSSVYENELSRIDSYDSCSELIRKLTKSLEQMKSWIAQFHTIDNESVKYLEILYKVYYDKKDYAQMIGDDFAKNNAVVLLVEYLQILTIYLTDYQYQTQRISINAFAYRRILGLLCNYTDASVKLRKELGNKKLIPVFLKELQKLRGNLDNEKQKIALSAIGILHNCAVVSENIKSFRQMDEAIPIIAWFSKNVTYGSESEIATLSMIILSHIVDKENKHLLDEQKIITQLLKLLSGAIASDDHRYNGHKTTDLISTLSHLAIDEKNSIMMVKKGILLSLYKLMKDGDEDEKFVATETIWSLSFCNENVRALKSIPKLIENLRFQAKHATDSKLQNAASWTLLVVEKIHKKENKRRAIEQNAFPEVEKSADLHQETYFQSNTERHVMISYNWECQPMMIKVNEKLKENGVKTWMDLERLSGSSLESMANAVENSGCVLICLSEKYKNSKNCRTEGEYVYKVGIPTIPIRVEKGYEPDGWLGALVGTKKYFNFTSESECEDNFPDFFREIKRVGLNCDI